MDVERMSPDFAVSENLAVTCKEKYNRTNHDFSMRAASLNSLSLPNDAS